ncbi:hypothetical protein LguiB_012945 [Lonicera macranthoides]
MSEERIAHLEDEIRNLSSSQEWDRHNLRGFMAAILARLDQILMPRNVERRESSVGQPEMPRAATTNNKITPKLS